MNVAFIFNSPMSFFTVIHSNHEKNLILTFFSESGISYKWLERNFSIVYLLEIQPKRSNFYRYSNEPVAFRWSSLLEWKFQDLISLLSGNCEAIPNSPNILASFLLSMQGLLHNMKYADVTLIIMFRYIVISYQGFW